MADGLSTLSSETLTAAVTSLLRKPLPESHIIKSTPIQVKGPTTTAAGNESHTQTKQLQTESHYVTMQPLKLPLHQDVCQNTGNPDDSAKRMDGFTGHQCSQQNIQNVLKNQVEIENQQIFISNNNIQLFVHPTLQNASSQDSNLQNAITVPYNRGLSQGIRKQSLINFPQQILNANQQQTNNLPLVLNRASLQPNTIPVNGYGVNPNLPLPAAGLSILQQLMSSQNHSQGQNLNNPAVQNMPVLPPGYPIHQYPSTPPTNHPPDAAPFSHLSPTQPLQNLIQHLFSNSDVQSLPKSSNTSLENLTATPVSLPNLEATNESQLPASHEKPPDIVTNHRDQDSYVSHINLLLEAIIKNKTLTPQQYEQIQKSISNNQNVEVKLSTPSTPVQSQNYMLQGQADVRMTQGQGRADVRMTQGQGDVRMTQGQADVTMTQGQSDVRMTQGQAVIRVNQGQGDVTMTQGQPDIRVNQGQGDVRMTQGQGDVRMTQADEGQAQDIVIVNQAEGDNGIPQGQGYDTELSAPEKPNLGQPYILQRVSENEFKLIPLTDLAQSQGTQPPNSVQQSVSPTSVTMNKGLVNIQPKPQYITTQNLLLPESANINSQIINLQSIYNTHASQQQMKDGSQPDQIYPSLSVQHVYEEGTVHLEDSGTVNIQTSEDYRNSAEFTAEPLQGMREHSDPYSIEEHHQDGHTEMTLSEENNQEQVCDENDNEDVDDDDDDYIYCIDCRRLCKTQCEIHTGIEHKFIKDSIILTRAHASLPSIFYLQQSSASVFKEHFGVWCKESINEGTRLGPVIGVEECMKTEDYKQQIHGFNPFQIYSKEDSTCVLNLDNEDRCNWIMFVRIAHSLLEQNCVLYKHRDKFYLTTICEIKEEEEMLMWFSRELCQFLGISEDPGVVKLQQCEHCGKYFTGKKLLNNHSKVIHPEKYKFSCGMCAKMFSCQSRLNGHMITHLGMKPFKCHLCGKCFSDASNLKQHMNIHTGVKKFQCETCGKSFRQKAHRDIHAVTHTGDKNYKCSYCDKSFARQSDLKTHTYRHTNELQYPCSYCDKVFYKTQALKKHLKVHTGERNYMCGKCFKGFHTKYHRDRHLKICKEKDGKETTYMSLEEVAKLDSTCDTVPLNPFPNNKN